MRKIILADHVSRDGEYSTCYRQGGLDGACGIYSLLVCFDLCGNSEDIQKFDKRTRFGKALSSLERKGFDLFIKGGLDLSEVMDFIGAGSYDNIFNTEKIKASGEKNLKFAIDHINEAHPTMLGLKNEEEGLDHWVTAIGLELFNEKTIKVLLIDPLKESTRLCPWNDYLSIAQPAEGPYPYSLSEGINVYCSEALAIWPKAAP